MTTEGFVQHRDAFLTGGAEKCLRPPIARWLSRNKPLTDLEQYHNPRCSDQGEMRTEVAENSGGDEPTYEPGARSIGSIGHIILIPTALDADRRVEHWRFVPQLRAPVSCVSLRRFEGEIGRVQWERAIVPSPGLHPAGLFRIDPV